MNRTALWNAVKNGRLVFNTVGDDLWASNTYWAMKAGDMFTDLLAEYNLKPEPMVCDTWRTIRRENQDPLPDFDKLLEKHVPTKSRLRRVEVEGNPIVLEPPSYVGLCEVWRTAGAKRHSVLVNKAFRSFVAEAAGVERWYSSGGPLKPTVGINGSVAALLMPIRVHFDLEAIEP